MLFPSKFQAMEYGILYANSEHKANIQCYWMFEWMKLTFFTHTHTCMSKTWKIDLVYGKDTKLWKHLVLKLFNHEEKIEFSAEPSVGCWTSLLHTATHTIVVIKKKRINLFKIPFFCVFRFGLVWFCSVLLWIKHEYFMYQNMHYDRT